MACPINIKIDRHAPGRIAGPQQGARSTKPEGLIYKNIKPGASLQLQSLLVENDLIILFEVLI